MAIWYVRSGASGTASGADWTNAKLTLSAALSGASVSDIIYASEDHSESTSGAITLTSPGSNGTLVYIYCVNHSGSVPPVSADLRTTGVVATTSVGNITINGSLYCYGLTFSAGLGSNAGTFTLGTLNNMQTYEACLFQINNTATTPRITLNSSASLAITWINTKVQFGATAQGIASSCKFIWRDSASAISGATMPTSLFTATDRGSILLDSVDVSATSGTIFVGTSLTNAEMRDCKINASATLCGTPSNPGSVFSYSRCSSGGNNYTSGKINFAGTVVPETTIVRTGGASDGTTGLSFKGVTSANSKNSFPLEFPVIAIWNDVAGSAVTATVCGIWGGGSVPNNDDIWIEVVYLGASGNPQGSRISSFKSDFLASNAALSSDSSTWGGSTTKFKMAVTFTPQQKGAILVYVKAVKPSSTFYVDPLVTLT